MGLRPDFTVESPAKHSLDYIHRRTENEEIYFVANSADEPVEARVFVSGCEGFETLPVECRGRQRYAMPDYRFENGAFTCH